MRRPHESGEDSMDAQTCDEHGHLLSDDLDRIDAECPNHVCQRCGMVGVRCSWEEKVSG